MTTPSVVLPQIIVEAGMTPAGPVQTGTSLVLGDATNGKLDTGTLGSGDIWSDISANVLNLAVTRPSSRLMGPLFQFQPGTLQVTVDNSAGTVDPDYAAGPFFGQIHAMVPLRARAIWNGTSYPLVKVFADAWAESAVSYGAGYSEWAISGTDAFKILSGRSLPTGASVGGGEDTGARISRLLDLAGWYTGAGTGARQLDTGDSTLQATTLGDTALNLMQLAADSEAGQLYIDPTGAVVFRHRRALLTDTRSNTSQVTFGDQPSGTTELACATVSRMDDDTTIGNDIQATRVGGALQEAQDATSIATYLFPRTYSRSDLILQDDPTAFQWAGWVLYIAKTGEDRFESITIDPAADPVNLWPQVLGRDIGDRITVIRRPPPSLTAQIVKDCFITGITHTFDATTSAWSTTWTLADATKYGNFLTLNNPTLGQLNNNALAF